LTILPDFSPHFPCHDGEILARGVGLVLPTPNSANIAQEIRPLDSHFYQKFEIFAI